MDFLFAMTLAAVLCMLMFAFTTTLSMIQISQYVAFSAARAQAAAHQEPSRQIELARAKFESFRNSRSFPALAPLFNNGWFEIDPKNLEIKTGGSDGDFNDDYGYQNNTLPQTGVRFQLQAKILMMNLPLMGQVTQEDDFTTYVTGFIFREPTASECREQMEFDQRFNAILGLDGRFNRMIGTPASAGPAGAYLPLEDNGC